MNNFENQKNKILNTDFLRIFTNPVFSLTIIGILGLSIRLYYFPWDIPIIDDGIDYFSYAVVTSQQGQLPLGWGLSNNGWPVFLSVFFSIFETENFIELIFVQRILSILISVLTIIPIYLLCTRFIGRKYAIIGSLLFSLDPRIIINSLLGITESSYIFLGTFSLFLFLSNRYRIISISFFTLGLFSIVRYEGFLIFIPFLILFIIRFRKDKKIFQKTILLIGIFFITISPMAYGMNQTVGNDSIITPILGGGVNYVSNFIIEGNPDIGDPIYGEDNQEDRVILFIKLGITNLIKFLGWVLIPIFVIFVPIGFLLLFRKKDLKIITVLVWTIVFLIPAFYLYGRGIEETRYLYILFPIFCIMSSFTVKTFHERMNKKKWIIYCVVFGIIFASIGFLDYKKIDYEFEKESYLIAKDIVKIAEGINHYEPSSKYIHIAEISKDWPIIPLPKETNYNQTFKIKKISPSGFSSLNEYIINSKDYGLTHIVTDGKQNVEFLNYVFENEKEFPFLVKVYDSKINGLDYHVKVYKIDYDKFFIDYEK